MMGKKQEGLQLFGPAALLCAIALHPLALLIAAPGFALATIFRMRGFAYALVLLGLGAFFNHGFVTHQHLWQIGLEASLACSLWIVALAQEHSAQLSHSLESQLEAQKATMRNLEEDLSKNREGTTTAQMAADVKITALQNRVEETEKEYSSLQILNEVLRKTAARHIEEKGELEKSSIDLQRKIGLMRDEIGRYEQKRPDRDELMRELNAARIAREQTHLINETLAKLHAQKCQELEQLRVQPQVVIPEGPSPVELLYNQLRRQFEEKSAVLHQTRQELFYKETELEAMRIEREQRMVDPLVGQMEQEVATLAAETAVLQDENKEMQELISTLLAQQPQPAARKKKVKKLTPVPLLF